MDTLGTSQPISILVDDRDVQSGIVDILRERDDVSVDIQRLPLGDYLIDEHLLVERKTLVDLVASIKDGRLFGQGCRLASSPLWTALILEGTSKDLAQSHMRREAIQGALITLTLFLGIPLLRSQSPRETVQLLLFAARQGRAVATGALPRPGRRPRGKARTQSRVLQGLPGVGPERAKRLLERFGSLEAVMLAEASELAAVPGIGKGTAEGIRWAVRESGSFYGSASHGIFPL
ncbi:MAG: ERCC4 domain-containing protein [Pseudomonadota bacterium]|nr:ERCC4 domain-containing protein [Pseudomonadota bacterium]